MFGNPTSIRKKITISFYLLFFFMICTALMTYGILRRVENKVVLIETVDDFFNATLELRRFEKNYFLYIQEKDYFENLRYLENIEAMLKRFTGISDAFAWAENIDDLKEKVDLYKKNMEQLYQYNTDRQASTPPLVLELEKTIRETGKKLTDFAELVSDSEKRIIQNLLQTTQKILIGSILLLFMLSALLATILGRTVVKSLKILEGYTHKISHGEFHEIAVPGGDNEITSLLKAFNRMNIELRTRQQQLVQSEKLASLGTLVSGVAHELNNPLSNISTSAQILHEEIEEADLEFKKNLINQIEEQSDKARDIVRSLLEFSRQKEFNKKKISLKKLLQDTILLLRSEVPSNVHIKLEVPEDLQIYTDKQRLQQVFLNLIKNGVQAVGEQGTIWISSPAGKKHGLKKEVEIMIEDDGPGIEPENLQKIFDPFFTTKDVGYGSGLGLFVVHDIIESLGGTIKVDSRPGTGTTFILWLPDEEKNHG